MRTRDEYRCEWISVTLNVAQACGRPADASAVFLVADGNRPAREALRCRLHAFDVVSAVSTRLFECVGDVSGRRPHDGFAYVPLFDPR